MIALLRALRASWLAANQRRDDAAAFELFTDPWIER